MPGIGAGPPQPPRNRSVAKHETVIMFKYSAMKNRTNCGTMNHEVAWACTIPTSDVDPARISTPTTDIVIASSYETICAVERTEPSSGYLELEAQPAREMP